MCYWCDIYNSGNDQLSSTSNQARSNGTKLINQSLETSVARNAKKQNNRNTSSGKQSDTNLIAAQNTQSSQISFQDVTRVAGVALSARTFGASWGDFNGDRLPDLWVNNHLGVKNGTPRKLFLNQGNGTFRDVFSEVFLPENLSADFHGAAWVDFDNDGDQDLVQLVGGENNSRFLPPDSEPNLMYVNEGGVLRDRARALGLAYDSAIAQTPIWLDINNDGLLDLFHTSERRKDGLNPTTIFRQTSQGFQDIGSTTLPSEFSQSEPLSHQYGVLSDVSGDGKLDLILPQKIASPKSNSVLNPASTPFVDITDKVLPRADLLNRTIQDIGAADFNNDLLPDLYLASSKEDRLLINTGQGLVDRTTQAGIINDPDARGFSVVTGDFDNDMDVDIYVTRVGNGNQPNTLYENQGNGTFVAVRAAAGASGSSRGGRDTVVTADYDLDGFLDLFVIGGSGVGESGPYQLFRNQGNGNNWLEIDLQGVTSNRDGIGARVFLTAGGVTQLREQGGGIHKWSQDHQRLHFGLAGNTQVDSLEIRWPSGIVQRLSNIPANQLLRVVESTGTVNPPPGGNPGGNPGGTPGGNPGGNPGGTPTVNVINGSANNDTLVGGGGDDVINGRRGNDRLVGQGGDDLLRGGAGEDTLIGREGNDRLIGGGKEDQLRGGQGNDTFFLTGRGGASADSIRDFNGNEDILAITGQRVRSNLNPGPIQARQFTLGSQARDRNDRFIYNQSTGSLFFDADGVGNANQVLLAKLTNRAALNSNNIVVA